MRNRFYPYRQFMAAAGILCLALAGFVAGDVVHLKNGGSFEGRVTERQESVVIELRSGSIEFQKIDVEKIEKKPLPEDIFIGRLQEASLQGADACVALARWAQEKELENEYIRALRTALLIDKDHQEARVLFREYRIHHANIPDNPAADEKMLADLWEDFRILNTPHYRICYNSADIFAETTSERLERLYEEFMAFFEDRHFEPAPLTDRLEVVLFDTAGQYYQYAQKMAENITYSEGFYSGKTGRSYFYDAISENGSQFLKVRDEVGKQMQTVKQQQREVTEALRKGPQQYVVTDPDGSQRKVTGEELLSELRKHVRILQTEFEKVRTFYTNQNVSITIHEGTHQLAYTCGIHSRYFATPVWLVEGLAVYFEAPQEGQWDRPGLVNRKRLETFSSSPPLRLKDLIVDDKLFYQNPSQSEMASAYATAWALFYYLVEEQHENLFDYIYDLALRITDQPYTEEERIADFEKYFGNPSRLERSWRNLMDQLIWREGIRKIN